MKISQLRLVRFSARARSVGVHVGAIIAGALCVFCLAAGPVTAEEAQKPVVERPAPPPAPPITAAARAEADHVAREAWRQDLARLPTPKTGCFTAAYPDRAWRETPCGRPSPHPNPRRLGVKANGHGANQVGNGNDYVAKTSGLLSSVTGSFLSPSSTSAVSGDVAQTSYVASNVFMLQINTQANGYSSDGSTFSTPACGTHKGCFGWEQFLFTQTQGPSPGTGQSSVAPGAPNGNTPGVFIEYWLNNYGTPCPALPSWALPSGAPATTPWNNDGAGDCWFNGPITYVPPQTAAELPNLVMTATAGASQDTVTLTTSSGAYVYSEPSVLSLSKVWTEAEFNVFGDCCLSEATFTTPSLLVVKTSINDGTTNTPTCVANDGTTGETNSLTFVPSPSGVCCAYGGVSPAVEFMEADSNSHTASCGTVRLEGDPHLTIADGTPNGTRYDFQGAGEFVALRDADGSEIQTRHTPVKTNFVPPADPHDGLANTVSVITAVAVRVGGHRVTWEPNLSGVPDPSGLELRIDGVVTKLGPKSISLGRGARVAPAADGALAVDFPDGKTLLVTPEWWADEGKWYLNVDVSHMGLVVSDAGGAGRGIAGRIGRGEWLPAFPDGASVGPMPASVSSRFSTLYGKFTEAWRVNDKDSLFDYAKGSSTAAYVQRDWPKPDPPAKVLDPVTKTAAETACKDMADENRRLNCVFDVGVTGNAGFAKTYLRTERNLVALRHVEAPIKKPVADIPVARSTP